MTRSQGQTFENRIWNPTHLCGFDFAHGVSFGSGFPITGSGFRFPGWHRDRCPWWHTRACRLPSNFSSFRFFPSFTASAIPRRAHLCARFCFAESLSSSKKWFRQTSFPSGSCLPPSRRRRDPVTPGTPVSNRTPRRSGSAATRLPPICVPPPRSLSASPFAAPPAG
jgi:hypothetical protein